MDGLMMDVPLTIQMILERARTLFPKKTIITREANGFHRYNYGDFYQRVAKLAAALIDMGIKPGDRVATFAWNNYRHLELYFAIPCIGAVVHTLNVRLAADQLAYIINHADDQIIFFDQCLLPAVKQFLPEAKNVRHFVVMDKDAIEDNDIKALSYEELLAAQSGDFQFPQLDEKMAAGLCYTSGTTGNPKGVLYSHRSLYLHAISSGYADTTALSEKDIVLPIVPMFHANAWGIPYAAAMFGSTQIFPNHFLQPQDVAEMFEKEKVTVTAGVPTIWLGLINLLEKKPYDLSSLRLMLVGGSAVPASMIRYFEEKYNLTLLQAWGMTETSPMGAMARLKSTMASYSPEERMAIQTKQGLPVAGVEIRAIDDDGNVVAWDGVTRGELQVRGPWVAAAYYNTTERAEAFQNGWFSTGDVVTIDAEGYIQIVDRTKDLIKSGGEWISSVDLENALICHPKVQEAAVIAVAHDKWVERPLACIVIKPEFRDQFDKEEFFSYLRERFASWWIPNDIVMIEEVPKTSVGKFDKKRLRDRFREFHWE